MRPRAIAPSGDVDPGPAHVRALDGIHGIAVLLVFLFHLNVSGAGGGFLGVESSSCCPASWLTSCSWPRSTVRGGSGSARSGRAGCRPADARADPPAVRRGRGDPLHGENNESDELTVGGTCSRDDLRGELAPDRLEQLLRERGSGQPSPAHVVARDRGAVLPGVAAGTRPRRHPGSSAAPGHGMLAGAGAIASALALAFLWSQADAVDRAYMGTDARILEPLIGALGAVVVASPRGRALVRRLGPLLLPVGVVGSIAAVATIRPQAPSYYLGGALAVSILTVMVVAPLWIGYGRRLGSVFALKPLAWLGVISYGVYLVALAADGVVRDPVGGRESRQAAARRVGRGAHDRRRRALVPPGRAPDPVRTNDRPAGALERRVAAPRGIAVGAGRHGRDGRYVRRGDHAVPPPEPGVPVILVTGDSVPLRLEAALERAGAARGWRIASAAAGGCPVSGEVTTWAGNPPEVITSCPAVVRTQDDALRKLDPDVVALVGSVVALGLHHRRGGARDRGDAPLLGAASRSPSTDRAATHREGATVVFVAMEPPGEGASTHCPRGCGHWVELRIDHYRDITARWKRDTPQLRGTASRPRRVHLDHRRGVPVGHRAVRRPRRWGGGPAGWDALRGGRRATRGGRVAASGRADPRAFGSLDPARSETGVRPDGEPSCRPVCP